MPKGLRKDRRTLRDTLENRRVFSRLYNYEFSTKENLGSPEDLREPRYTPLPPQDPWSSEARNAEVIAK